MDIQQLRNFSVVAKLGSITKAAEALYMSQPNLSMNIKRLEKDIGVPLFERSKTSIRLTPLGNVFLEYVDQSLSKLDEGIDEINRLYSAPQKMFSVAAIAGIYLRHISRAFAIKYPDMPIHQEINTVDKIVAGLINGDIEVAIVPEMQANPALECMPVSREIVRLLVSDNHPLAREESVSISQLKNERIVSDFAEFPTEYIHEICRNAGFAPNITCECNDSMITGIMVEEGLGVAFAGHHIEGNLPGPVTLIPFREEITREIVIVKRKGSILRLPLEELLELCGDSFRSPGGS